MLVVCYNHRKTKTIQEKVDANNKANLLPIYNSTVFIDGKSRRNSNV
jgi:hypothetical protein